MSLDSDGFVLLRGFLDSDETALAIALVETTLSVPHDTACNRPNNLLVPVRWNNPIVRLVLGLSSRIQGLRTKLHADDLRWISGYISVKEPRSPALWWHSDWWCWDHPVSFHRRASQVAVLTYLSDTSEANGALR